jgi:hypothetical protein
MVLLVFPPQEIRRDTRNTERMMMFFITEDRESVFLDGELARKLTPALESRW